MREKNEIIKEFKNLVSDLKKHNKSYYVDDAPKITDQEYDLLKKKNIKIRERFFVPKKNSINY